MSAPLGSADFFALEAGECLDHLDGLISRPDGGDASQMLRYARALRGSALMANQTALARAAAGFEALARAIRDGKRSMDAATRERAAQAVDDVRHLVRRVKEWAPADEARATRVASELAALAGGDLRDPRQAPGPAGQQQAQTGIRAFVAREGALVASALDRAARSLESAPEAREPLYAVLRRLQSLRGLAELSELSPLPEVLDGIELAVGDLTRLFAPPPGVPALLDAGAAALTRIARDVAERGAPDPGAVEPQVFTDRLLRAFASEADVIPIERLLDGVASDAMVRSTAQPQFAPPSPLGSVELVSHGEHLVQTADQILSAPSSTARDLRLYALLPALRAAGTPGRDALTPALARFADGACRAIARGAALADLSGFAETLRAAGATLRSVADAGPSSELAAQLDRLTRQLDPELAGAKAAPETELDNEPAAIEAAPVGLVAEEEEPDGVVPIESLAYDESLEAVEPEPVSILALAPDRPLPLESGFTDYRRRVLSSPGVTTAAGATVVEITALCYSGRAALERAAEVRSEITARLTQQPGLDVVDPLVRELLDLVPLALNTA
jgi:chemotaxis protein histidine kinase CheA